MKKLLMLLPVLGLSFLLCSCSKSPADRAEDYAKQTIELLKKGDFAKVGELEKEIEEYVKTLSPEENKEFEEAGEKYMAEHEAEAAEAMKSTFGGLGDALNGLNGAVGDAMDDAADATEDVMNEAAGITGDAMDDAADAVENAIDDAADALNN